MRIKDKPVFPASQNNQNDLNIPDDGFWSEGIGGKNWCKHKYPGFGFL